jgi:NADPH-dependent 2,4-dienoyl-CoA reductase/sulfur reductase-like enzyme
VTVPDAPRADIALPEATVDVVVVGAGPAGVAAAVAAVRAGARVVLLDSGPRAGGQYWRQGPSGLGPYHHNHAGWTTLADGLAEHTAEGRLEHRADHQVWRVDPLPEAGSHAARRPPSAVVHAVTTTSDGFERPVTLAARALVLATGAHDRVLPFPGWDLPGVLTPGAAQAMLKEHGVVAGSRVVVGGTGPFLLPVAAGLAQAGARVVALVEAGDGSGWLRGWRAVARCADRVGEGAGYARTLVRHRVVPRLRTAVIAAHGDDRVRSVTIARLDPQWRPLRRTARRLRCDAVAVGWGFTARTDLALQAGARPAVGPDGGPAVDADDWGRTAAAGILVAGELTGIGGAELAELEGRLAGAAAARYATSTASWTATPPAAEPALARRRQRLTAFAAALHTAHPLHPGWVDWLDEDTLVCRCEEVPLRRLHEAVDELGATDARTAKLLTRCGMGWCQGRICGEPVSRLIAARRGDPASAVPELTNRPVAAPITLGALIAGGPPSTTPP